MLESDAESPSRFADLPNIGRVCRLGLATNGDSKLDAHAVALMAPNDGRELSENLALLDEWRGLTPQDYEQMQLHGDRVRRHAPNFP